jgi:hypothetical protein
MSSEIAGWDGACAYPSHTNAPPSENNGAFGSEQIADAHFINEPVARVCHPEPDAEVDYEVVAEFEISSGKD